jgi:hypothetical protein
LQDIHLHFLDGQHLSPQHFLQHWSTEHPAGQEDFSQTTGLFLISGEQQPLLQHSFLSQHLF